MIIVDYEIMNLGIESAQYFQGYSAYGTGWHDCMVGCGSNAFEAMEDALDQLASGGIDTDEIKVNPFDAHYISKSIRDQGEDEELYQYIAILYKHAPCVLGEE